MAREICANCVGDGKVNGKTCNRCHGSGYEPTWKWN